MNCRGIKKKIKLKNEKLGVMKNCNFDDTQKLKTLFKRE